MAAQPPVPNAANLQAAVNGMTTEGNIIAQSVQAYNAHQQALNTELSLCANYNVAQIHQQLAAIPAIQANVAAIQANTAAVQASVAAIQTSVDTINAQSWNVDAKVENAKLNSATGTLVVMRAVNPAAHAQINQNIPNFPAAPDAVTEMPDQDCRALLRALNKPIPQGPNIGVRQLQTAVRKVIGLPAI